VKIKTILLGCLILSILSCSTTRKWRKELEREWLGKTKTELLDKLGQPDKINTKDVPGTEILIYIHMDFTPDIPPNTYSKDYFINQDGKIYKIETYSW
jgi:hypothetical protein